ncbi:MAG: hypothetical protein WCQ49_01750 [Candidatus Saccharibacteria bacterium]
MEQGGKWSIQKKVFLVIGILVLIMAIGGVALTIFSTKATFNSYSSLTLKAMKAKQKENIDFLEVIAEQFNNENDFYPSYKKDLTEMAKSIGLTRTVPILNSPTEKLKDSNGQDVCWYQYSNSLKSSDGGRIQYWDYDNNKISTEVIYIGKATKDSSFYDLK